ncbi:polyribonucleotide nucleotidyltransferase [Thermodesulfobacteriota bacterium]
MKKTFKTQLSGKDLIVTTGHMAKQANGSVLIQYGDTAVLVTATAESKRKKDLPFFPFICNYQEKTYAAGKIPGGFFKREGRPTEKDTLTSRLIDRPFRPFFEDDYQNDTQIIATVLSVDLVNDPDVIAIVGASVAMSISNIPVKEPLAAVRVGRVNGELICNPTYEQRETSDIDIVVAASGSSILMVEGSAKFVPELEMLDAIMFAHENIKPLIAFQNEIKAEIGVPNMEFDTDPIPEEISTKVAGKYTEAIEKTIEINDKIERYRAQSAIKKEIIGDLVEEFEGAEKKIGGAVDTIKKNAIRSGIVAGKRIGGRGPKDIRDITCEIGVIPRTHGSGLFTRGETQAIVLTTLGTGDDAQRIDALEGETKKTFMLHYNFPPFCVGEVSPLRGAGRREIGHGILAERALTAVLPDDESFPYTIRIVSEILESNGSSSMASVCGGALSLMDAGVPISAPVAGIAMGLIQEGDDIIILSDILGDEDHVGDMDFKVAGTAKGVTALQMDIKIDGVTKEILEQALTQAREGKEHILGKMMETINEPNAELSKYAPRITVLYVKKDRIRDVIGPGGKNIKNIIEVTGVKMDVDDTGRVSIASVDEAASAEAVQMVKDLTDDAEIGKNYLGTVKRIENFGAFVEILPGKDGLVHISQLEKGRVENVTDVLKIGEKVLVKVIDIDNLGRVKLSRKDALGEEVGGDA